MSATERTCAGLAEVVDLLAEAWLEPAADVRARAAALAVPVTLRERSDRGVGCDLVPDRLPTARAQDDQGARPVGLEAAVAALAAAPDADLAVEFARVFLHGRGGTAHPYESYFATRRVGDPAVVEPLEELLAAAGVAPDAGRAVPADHVGVELALLALLLRGLGDPGVRGAGRREVAVLTGRLVHGHLAGWLPALGDAARAAAPSPYHVALLDATLGAVAVAAALAPSVDIEPKPTTTRRGSGEGRKEECVESP